jgi:hypothetical protein
LGHGWVRIGTKRDVQGDQNVLDGYLKRCIKRQVANYVVMLERAGVVELDRQRPARVRLRRSSTVAKDLRRFLKWLGSGHDGAALQSRRRILSAENPMSRRCNLVDRRPVEAVSLGASHVPTGSGVATHED